MAWIGLDALASAHPPSCQRATVGWEANGVDGCRYCILNLGNP